MRIAVATVSMLVAVACSSEPPAPWPEATPEPDAETERFVEDLLARMSLEQKIGQIIQAELQHVSPEDVREFGLGSVLNGGGSFPGLDRRAPVAQWSALVARFQQASRQPMAEGLPAIPVLWGTDAVLLLSGEPVDLPSLRERGAAITFDIRLESESPRPVSLAIECGESCVGEVPLAEDLGALPTREWQNVHVNLACLESAGADLSKVLSVFTISADGLVELSLANIRIKAAAAQSTKLGCAD